MKFTLKDYQESAVADVLVNLRKARKRWHEDNDQQAFSLTATTGAGKTVMAAAVIEALFYGSAEFPDFEPDPGAVVIWFSDDPSLNEQSKYRLHEASDKLTVSDLITVENTFSQERFRPGKVYFVNTHKFASTSLLVRGYEATGTQLTPDGRSHLIWETIQNTIEDPDLTLYFVLDEAHRGMKTTPGRGTIVKRLIGGEGNRPGMPIVWGISATIERFNNAISELNLEKLKNIVVDPKTIQESGLLKDTINLDVPDEVGDMTTVLLRRGTAKLRELSNVWREYSKDQGELKTVIPLMVLQVPNSPDHNEIGEWLQTVFDEWPDLDPNGIANVFGEHKEENFGGFTAPYVSPERIQERDDIRIIIAKDAISTGWDCPRAEVMVSFRAATDNTHITQLLGRMIRTPLARRIPGNELLNSVDCLLPHFNRTTVEKVVDTLMNGGERIGDHSNKRILINPIELKPNPRVPHEVWRKFASLPSQSLPKKKAKPIRRLTILAHELARDGIMPNAGAKAHEKLHAALDGFSIILKDQVEEAKNNVLTVEGATLTADVQSQKKTFNEFVEDADSVVIEDAFKRAARLISPDLARSYAEHLASKFDEEFEDEIEALEEARTEVAAFGLVPEIKERLDVEAENLANHWLTTHRVAIKNLGDKRQDKYREIQSLSKDPIDSDLICPTAWLQKTEVIEESGKTVQFPKYEHHLMCDADGLFPEDFNSQDEPEVLAIEMKRSDFLAWYRNPPRASQDSLGVTYEHGGEVKIVRPDFIFFSRLSDGEICADIVDPHGTFLSDAISKLRGLADFAEQHGAKFRRIDSIARSEHGKLKVLDLKEHLVREAIRKSENAATLFAGELAVEFDV